MKRIAVRAKTRSTPRNVLDVSDYPGEWVAIDPSTYEILGHGDSPEQATDNVPGDAILYLVPRSDAFFIGPAA